MKPEMTFGHFAAAFLACAFASLAHAQTIIYVNATAAGGNGQTWGTASNSLQAALSTARATASVSNPVELWVAQGTYCPAPANGDRDIAFVLANNVALYGGFSGTESVRTQRDWRAHPTFLSGDLNGDDASFDFGDAHWSENSRRVIIALTGQNASAIIDGFVVTDGYNDGGATNQPDCGSGFYLNASSATIRNVTVTKCWAAYGSGLYAIYLTTPLSLENDQFIRNGSHFSGQVTFANSTPTTMTNCLVVGRGGTPLYPSNGKNLESSGDLTLVNCTITVSDPSQVTGTTFGIFMFGPHVLSLDNTIVFGCDDNFSSEYTSATATLRARNSCIPLAEAQATFGARFIENVSNLNGDPGFANRAAGDFSLLATSQCVDTGSNSLLVAGQITDLAHNFRVADGNDDAILVCDIGPYEFRSRPFLARVFVRSGDNGNGSSWSSPFGSLADALRVAAVSNGGVNEIWVASGTYKPSPPIGQGGSRSATFQLQNNLAIYGGFAGTETALSQRNIAANPTILSGDLNGNDLGDLRLDDNSFHVVSGDSVGETAVLDGFMITAGHTTSDEGAGLYLTTSGSPAIRSCTFRANRAFVGGAAVVRVVAPSYPLFERCVFQTNSATGAAGAFHHGGPGQSRFVDCDFIENTTNGGLGGAVHFNAGPAGGGSAKFTRCRFVRNHSDNLGGAVDARNNAIVDFVQCQFLGNSAGVPGNEVTGGGAMHCTSGAVATITNCLFVGNTAPTSGAIGASSGASYNMFNCTVVANVTGSANFGALALTAGPFSAARFRSCLAWGNTNGGSSVEGAQFGANPPGSYDIRTTSVQGWTNTLGGEGNNDLDPHFIRAPFPGPDGVWGAVDQFGNCDDDYGDLRLISPSPAIDSGESSAVPLDIFVDLLGFPRFVDDPQVLPNGGTPVVDRGCYEAQVNCLACPGVREWRSPIGGNFTYQGNWIPSVPNATHDTIFDLAATYDVNFPTAALLTAKTATVRQGDVGFNLGGSTWSLASVSSTSLVVGDDKPSLASLSVFGGTLQTFSALVGTEAGSQGNLHVSGVGSTVRVTNDMSIGFFGKGTAIVDGGARLVTRTAGVGDQPGSDGSKVTVTGPGSRWDVPFFLQINNGEVNVSSGATLSAGFGIFLFQNGTLSGNGTINGDVVNFGALRPGNSPGTLTINGNYEQVGVLPDLGASTGRLVSEIAGTPASGNFDKVVVHGIAKLGGLLQVDLTSNHIPASNEIYQLVTATGGVQGRFDVALFPSIGSDKFLYATYPQAGTQVTLGVLPLSNDPNLSPQENRTIPGTPTAAALGDLDGDGLLDLAVTVSNGDNDAGSVVIFRNLGGAGAGWNGFSNAQIIQIPVGKDPRGIVLARLDDTGGSANRLDIAVCNASSNDVTIIRNLGSNIYAPGSVTPVGNRPVAIAAFNLDGDTKVDLATANHNDGTISLLRGNGAGGISSISSNPNVPDEPDTIEPCNPTTDKGGVTSMNLAIGSRTATAITLLRNDGTGNFTALAPIAIGVGTGQILCRDVNDDGRADLLTGNTDGSISVILNTTTGSNPLVLAFQPAVNLPVQPATFPGDGVVSLTAFKADAADTDRDIAVAVRTGGVTRVRFLRNDLVGGNLAFTLRPDLVGSEANPIALVSAYVDDEFTTQDLVIVGSDGDGRPGGLGGRAVGQVRPVLAGSLCPADFNHDSAVDFFDYDEFVQCFEGGTCPPGASADFNNDTAVDFFDYDAFVVAFELGC